MAKLLIVRGLPGSGKSTYAKAYAEKHNALHVETDMYFTDQHGRYTFIREQLSEAHTWCKSTVKHALESGHDVVVSNTFSQYWEFIDYYRMGFPTQEITIEGHYVNVHNCPDEVIEAMRKRWQK